MNFNDYELLIFMSDEHSGLVTGYGGDNAIIRTPNLNRIAKDSAVFSQAYTSSPVCVPARASFMTGMMASSLGVYNNGNAYSSGEATFIHSLGLAGYETVLCGRMHFMGLDQRHGFERRIAEDITPTHWGYIYTGAPKLQKGGPHGNETDIYPIEKNSAYFYDKYVVDKALEWLSQDHEKKQAMIVGTYMPHMPLGGPEDKVSYYKDKVLDNFHSLEMDYAFAGPRKRPCYDVMKNRETLREIRANYYAMVEAEDERIGQVYDSFCRYLKRNGKKGIFIYLSDHGDQMGEKGYIGKRLFFEDSERIPLLIQKIGTDGKPECGGKKIDTPVSIMDVAPTICSMCGALALPGASGRDLSVVFDGKTLEQIPIVSEYFEFDRQSGNVCAGFMVRLKTFKYITYIGHEDCDLLFDLVSDPYELHNSAGQYPEILNKMYQIVENRRTYISWHMENARRLGKNERILSQWGLAHPALNETWEMEVQKRA